MQKEYIIYIKLRRGKNMNKLKINKKFFRRSIAISLLIVTPTLTSCSSKNEVNFSPNSFDISPQTLPNKVKEVAEYHFKSIKANPLEELLNILNETEPADYMDTTEYCLEYNRNLIPDRNNTIDEIDLAAYAYAKSQAYNISNDDLLSELNNLMVEQTLPRCMDIEEWNNNFSNLISTLDDKESLQDTYYVLAYLIHNATCDKEHTIDECNSVSCETLEQEFQKKYK